MPRFSFNHNELQKCMHLVNLDLFYTSVTPFSLNNFFILVELERYNYKFMVLVVIWLLITLLW